MTELRSRMSMAANIIQRFGILQKSVSTLIDDPEREKDSSANYYLTMQSLMLLLFALCIVNKHFLDLFEVAKQAWPVKSQNFRNPLSLGAVMMLGMGIPIFLFWRNVGKTSSNSRKIGGKRYYASITFFSSIVVNIGLLFVAAKLNLPEVSFILGVCNFFVWARWSVREYARLAI